MNKRKKGFCDNPKVESLEGEYWIPIKGYEDIYEISNLCRIKQVDKLTWKGNPRYGLLLNQYLKKDGYVNVILYKNGKRKDWRVHRLLAINFIPNPNNYPIINHINGIRNFNTIENLMWCTQSYNVKDGFERGRINPNQGKRGKESSSKTRLSPVAQFKYPEMIFIQNWDCIADAERELDLFAQSISLCCLGKLRQTGGFTFRYI